MKKLPLILFLFIIVNFGCKQKEQKPEKINLNKIEPTDSSKLRPNDSYSEYYSSGKLKAEGHLINGLREGTWISYSPEGVIMSKCFYTKGVKNGLIEVYYPNGVIRYKGSYTNNKESGNWVFYNENGGVEKTKKY